MPLRHESPRSTRLALTLLGSVLLFGGCGVPPELRPEPGASVPAPTGSPTPIVLPPSLNPVTRQASPAPFPETVATECLGRPSSAQVIALVRKSSSILPASAKVTVTAEPVCAATWQYTVISVPGHEPLQIVSKGTPTALTLVTAGTDVCTIEVRNYAPPGIRIVARC